MSDKDEDLDWPVPMTCEKWAFAVALLIERERGADGPAYIAERRATFEEEGHADGVATWDEIAAAYQSLTWSDRPAN